MACRSWMLRRSAPVLIGLAAACLGDGGFVCEDDSECLDRGVQGYCEGAGVCSFPDDTCESGRRYGTLGDIDVAGQCVGLPEGDTGTDTDSGGTSAGSAGSASAGTTTSSSASDSTTLGTSSTTGPTTEGTTGVSASTTDETSDGTSDSAPGTTDEPDPITVSFGEGDEADVSGVTKDTFITAERPDQGNGIHPDVHFLDGAGATALIAFDLTDIPGGAVIVSVELRLATEEEGAHPDPVHVYEVLEDWTEGGENFEPGVANWTERTASAPWTSEGAGPGSRGTTVLATFDADEINTTITVVIPPSVVQGWVDDPSSNFGLAMTSGTEAPDVDTLMWVSSRENDDQDERPLLTVTYLP